MDSKDIKYSLKNIPIPAQSTYLKCLVDKVESFVKRLRWKVFFYEKKLQEAASDPSGTRPNKDDEQPNLYGFKSPKTPPQNDYLKKFEEDLYLMIHNLEFNNKTNDFQKQLKNDVKSIKASKKLTVCADKSPNLYEMDVNEYKKMLANNITTSYKKSNTNNKAAIDREARHIVEPLGLTNRVQCIAEKDAFITLKDHKKAFRNNPTCRLINPTKSEVGHISKVMLERIIANVKEATGYNLWRNTSTVTEWFTNIQDKPRCRFIKLDICEFYPSISEDLLNRALEFAKLHTTISDDEVATIKHARKSLLFNQGTEWIKKNATEDLFDVTMGSFDGAEICELVGLFMLSKLEVLLGQESVGLYRDDGLAAIGSESGRILDRFRKDIIELFKSENLSITIETNLKITDFLDATLNLRTGKYSPFLKPDSKPLYIHRKSNHPPAIIKQLPNMISKRISDLSSDEGEFNKAKSIYEDALRSSGYPDTLTYCPSTNTRRRSNRKVIWFNPPYSSNVQTSIGKIFLRLINKHFPQTHRYAKILNRNTLKISYSCMPSMKNIISQQNSRLLRESNTSETQRQCNCVNSSDCPFDGACLTTGFVYTATVNHDESENIYHGLTDGPGKARYHGHMTSFRHEDRENETELSKLVWKLKRRGTPFTIKWKITQKAQSYRCGSGRCDLCLTEKVVIARCRHPGMLNKRTELISKCRHRNKFLLASVKSVV